jgi:predicted nuclease of predicted toxin-antitoxin system
MKLLRDENISHRMLPIIEEYFSGSVHVKDISEAPASDRFIWEHAKEHNYIIVTYDEDFYEWQQLRGFPPYVVWLRFGNAPTKYITQKLLNQKDKILKLANNKEDGTLEIQ